MKMINNVKRFLCLALCLCMTMGMLVMVASCGEEEETEGSGDGSGAVQTEAAKAGEVAVLKALVDIEPGTQLTAENVAIGYALEQDIPFNAVRVLDKVLNKYAEDKIVKGDYIFQGHLTATAPTTGTPNPGAATEAYIVVKDYITDGADAATVIQELIKNNPGRTLFFPDGTYTLSKPIVTPSDPAKSVSLRLSNYAILKADSNWTGGDKAMVRIGAGDSADASVDPTTSAYFMGGIVDGNGVAKAISVEDGRNVLISNVSIKKATCGITIMAGTSGATHTDIENVNITGADATKSVGVSIASSGNTLTSVRINTVKTGVELTGSNNVLRNVHAMYSGTATDSCGFYDNSNGNNYDMCFSEDFAIGYRMGTNAVSVYSACGIFWNSTSGSQTAFKADGQFNSVVRSCKAEFGASGSYLTAGSTGGKGQILYPIICGTTSDTYSYYLKTAAIKY